VLTVALTGDVAAGKSTVAGIWKEAGVPVVSADELAREVTAVGNTGLAEVRSAFGEGVIAPDGSLDRDAMRGLAFRDPAVRARLEAILHPRIEARRRDWMEARRKEGASLVVAEIPLLFEVGLDEAHDVSVVVTGPAAVRLPRLADRGVDAGEARRIMDAQMEPGRKAALADYVLENDGTLEDLEGRALALLDVLRRRAERE
jgi:dephospho-CoA kinase